MFFTKISKWLIFKFSTMTIVDFQNFQLLLILYLSATSFWVKEFHAFCFFLGKTNEGLHASLI